MEKAFTKGVASSMHEVNMISSKKYKSTYSQASITNQSIAIQLSSDSQIHKINLV